MALTINHSKTNNIADWTQADLDAQIALGNFPPGTLLADIVLPSDWNDGHSITGSVGWGEITGTLSGQTDLQTALDAKAPTASPTFTGTVTVSSATANKMAYFGASKEISAATNAEVENNCIRLPNISTPTAPAAGGNLLFGRSVGGRSMPSFIGPSGLDTALQAFLGRNNFRFWQAIGNASTVNVVGASALSVTAGSQPAYNVNTSNGIYGLMRRAEALVTTPGVQAVAGYRHTVQQICLGNAAGLGGFTFVCRWAPATGLSNTEHISFCGLRNDTGAPQGGVAPSAFTNQFGMGYDKTDTNVQFIHNDGSGTSTKIDLGANFPKPSVDRDIVYELNMFSAPNSGEVSYEVRDLKNGHTATGTVTTDLPAGTQLLNPVLMVAAGGTTSAVAGVSLTSLYIETDY